MKKARCRLLPKACSAFPLRSNTVAPLRSYYSPPQPETWNSWATIPATTVGAIFSGGLNSPRVSSTIKTNVLHAFVLIFTHWFGNTQCPNSWKLKRKTSPLEWAASFFVGLKRGGYLTRAADRNVVTSASHSKNSKIFHQSNRWRFIGANISTCVQCLNLYDESNRK